jgi:hypothetical protein
VKNGEITAVVIILQSMVEKRYKMTYALWLIFGRKTRQCGPAENLILLINNIKKYSVSRKAVGIVSLWAATTILPQSVNSHHIFAAIAATHCSIVRKPADNGGIQ